MKAPIQVILVDDQPFIREAVKDLLKSDQEISVLAEFNNGDEVVHGISAYHRPYVILMDISMPYMDGVQATEILNKNNPDMKILGFTLHDKISFQQAMLDAGARGLVSKTASKRAIVKAIKDVAAGLNYADHL